MEDRDASGDLAGAHRSDAGSFFQHVGEYAREMSFPRHFWNLPALPPGNGGAHCHQHGQRIPEVFPWNGYGVGVPVRLAGGDGGRAPGRGRAADTVTARHLRGHDLGGHLGGEVLESLTGLAGGTLDLEDESDGGLHQSAHQGFDDPFGERCGDESDQERGNHRRHEAHPFRSFLFNCSGLTCSGTDRRDHFLRHARTASGHQRRWLRIQAETWAVTRTSRHAPCRRLRKNPFERADPTPPRRKH